MPVTIKESAAVAGWPTRKGSLVTSTAPAASSAVFVERIEVAGGVLLGKTRAPEFNWKGVTDSPGFGITRNPWNTDLTPGGSSGGCAAAVAAGITRVSMGSDAGGSVRIPASFTGTVALKPTLGRIPVTPLPSAFHHVVHLGPIAACTADLRDMMSIVAGPSSHDWTSLRLSNQRREGDASGLRIGILRSERWRDSVSAVHDGMSIVTNLLEREGFSIEEVDLDVATATRAGIALYRAGCISTVESVSKQESLRLDQGLLRFGAKIDGISDQVIKALEHRDMFGTLLAAVFDRVDVLMLPTLPIVAIPAGRNVPENWHSDDWTSWNPYTPAFNLAQVPALSFPVWPDRSPLPMGVQLVANHCREDKLLSLAQWLERKLPIKLVA